MEVKEAKTIVLHLSEENSTRIFEKCGRQGITVSQLLENFISDLAGGTSSGGSDERDLAEKYFERCCMGRYPEKTLLKWLFDNWISVHGFLELIEDIESGYADLEKYNKDPAAFDEEEIGYLKEDIADWEEQPAGYKARYFKENPDADWEKEVENTNKWWKEKELFYHERG